MVDVAGAGWIGGPDEPEPLTVPRAALSPELPSVRRVGGGFIALYAAACMGTAGLRHYMAVDLALVVDVLPGDAHAKDLGVLNIANALPFSVAPALAPGVLAVGGGSYGLLYTVAGISAVLGAGAILPLKRVR